jgi:hypothetical protein
MRNVLDWLLGLMVVCTVILATLAGIVAVGYIFWMLVPLYGKIAIVFVISVGLLCGPGLTHVGQKIRGG